ncbi:MAG: 5-(carboxyamino)imidazole ribonucleotide synthase [Beijerinckiaceae bacterium]
MTGPALTPGATVGILGGGQLGRMLALAAAPLGLRCHVFAPEQDSPAFHVAAASTCAGYRDEKALAAFAAQVDVITYEFENVPVETIVFLETLKPVRPGAKALRTAQDRLKEKELANALGAHTAPFAPVNSRADLDAAIAKTGLPAILKTNRFGYDGKGQAKIITATDADAAWAAMRNQPAILEGFVNFECEISVVAARGIDGAFAAFDVTHNEHRNHILHKSIAPAAVDAGAQEQAIAIARKIADALGYVGVFAVEFFLERTAQGPVVRVNEIAPRVHNSGHWTMEGAQTSQFEQHMRAVAGWPLGSTRMTGKRATMLNLIGDDAGTWQSVLAEPGAHLHLYGKGQARDGRKMGHVNRIEQ